MRISFHHIGGRWGTIPPIAKWIPFFPTLDITLYEPDKAAAAKLERMDLKASHGYASVHVQADCLGETNGVSDFYLCFDRSASSMFPFDKAYSEFATFIQQRGRGVYKLGTAHQSEVIQVNVRSMASLISEGKISLPDILSIDAEGAAFPILKGLGQQNLRQTIGLFIEASLISFRKGESHLYDVLRYLTDEGFMLFQLGSMARYSFAEMHLGAFDRGPYASIEDTLFLKDPAKVDAPEALEKLALIGILSGALSLTYECFKKMERLGHDFKSPKPSDNIGNNCIRDFYSTFETYRDITLPKLDETFNVEIYNFMQYSDDLPGTDVMDRYMAHTANTIPKYLNALAYYKAFEKKVPTHDVLYEKYGMPELAQAAKAERMKQIEFLKDALARVGVLRRG